MQTQVEQECRSRSRTHTQENGAKHCHLNREGDSPTTPSWLVVLVEETQELFQAQTCRGPFTVPLSLVSTGVIRTSWHDDWRCPKASWRLSG